MSRKASNVDIEELEIEEPMTITRNELNMHEYELENVREDEIVLNIIND